MYQIREEIRLILNGPRFQEHITIEPPSGISVIGAR